jgi:hypothetical protein
MSWARYVARENDTLWFVFIVYNIWVEERFGDMIAEHGIAFEVRLMVT